MDTVLVEIVLPAASVKYDVLVPVSMQVGTLTRMASRAYASLSDGQYEDTGGARLCEAGSGKEYDPSKVILNTDIKNGTKLLLI